MSGRKNVYQHYGAFNNPVQGKDIWARHNAFMSSKVDNVYCKVCGNTIEMPSAEGPGSKFNGMEIYQIEIQHQIHEECARELDRNGVKY